MIQPQYTFIVYYLLKFLFYFSFTPALHLLGREDFALKVSCYVVQSTEDAMLFMTMMMASEGWCVLRPNIKNIRCALIPG